MAMTKCKECKKEVSAKAKVCPHCGVKDPGFSAIDAFKGLIFLAVLGSLAYWYFGSDDDAVAKEPVKEKVCAANDGQCIFDKYLVDAIVACQRPIQERSKYEYEWTDTMFEHVFSRYVNKPEKHQIVFIGDRLKFTNGFNAKVNMTYSCTFDTKSQQPVDYNVAEGRLPK